MDASRLRPFLVGDSAIDRPWRKHARYAPGRGRVRGCRYFDESSPSWPRLGSRGDAGSNGGGGLPQQGGFLSAVGLDRIPGGWAPLVEEQAKDPPGRGGAGELRGRVRTTCHRAVEGKGPDHV